ncbi:hypothetical protein FGO68_gene450 [Halteria grandinella]|uniref:CDC20/Fizzy WD40 domain-containing protein n=1 Tax=Halteria grandinella TaxID=5974 RepID=A0A8J8SUW9_HALGN|nr:hypothetical protein FGO68_gene450 [Halteria grandinella]
MQQQQDENQRLYNTLLQNQVLGIHNPHLIQGSNLNDDYTDTQGCPEPSIPLQLAPPSSYNILRFSDQSYTSRGASSNLCQIPLSGFEEEDLLTAPYRQQRTIPKVPFKVLDAPALQDDFYLNLVDWSSSNILAVGLGSSVYLWSATSNKVTKLYDLAGANDSVASVQWSEGGNHLAVGTHSGSLQVWDTAKGKLLRTLSGHEERVGSIAWNSRFISTGSRDKSILHRDLRTKNNFEAKLLGHKQEVCGLKWSFDEQQLASGGNDNKLLLWSVHNCQTPQAKFSSHIAAVKAIAWSPHQHGLLASGGGTADKTIRFWNTHTLQPSHHVDTGSQVCNLLFSKNVNELVSTHGYSQNQIFVWKYPTMKKLATLNGHTLRVLYLACSPDGQTLVTGAGDETLRFWNVFPPKRQIQAPKSCIMPNARLDLR